MELGPSGPAGLGHIGASRFRAHRGERDSPQLGRGSFSHESHRWVDWESCNKQDSPGIFWHRRHEQVHRSALVGPVGLLSRPVILGRVVDSLFTRVTQPWREARVPMSFWWLTFLFLLSLFLHSDHSLYRPRPTSLKPCLGALGKLTHICWWFLFFPSWKSVGIRDVSRHSNDCDCISLNK